MSREGLVQSCKLVIDVTLVFPMVPVTALHLVSFRQAIMYTLLCVMNLGLAMFVLDSAQRV